MITILNVLAQPKNNKGIASNASGRKGKATEANKFSARSRKGSKKAMKTGVDTRVGGGKAFTKKAAKKQG